MSSFQFPVSIVDCRFWGQRGLVGVRLALPWRANRPQKKGTASRPPMTRAGSWRAERRRSAELELGSMRWHGRPARAGAWPGWPCHLRDSADLEVSACRAKLAAEKPVNPVILSPDVLYRDEESALIVQSKLPCRSFGPTKQGLRMTVEMGFSDACQARRYAVMARPQPARGSKETKRGRGGGQNSTAGASALREQFRPRGLSSIRVVASSFLRRRAPASPEGVLQKRGKSSAGAAARPAADRLAQVVRHLRALGACR